MSDYKKRILAATAALRELLKDEGGGCPVVRCQIEHTPACPVAYGKPEPCACDPAISFNHENGRRWTVDLDGNLLEPEYVVPILLRHDYERVIGTVRISREEIEAFGVGMPGKPAGFALTPACLMPLDPSDTRGTRLVAFGLIPLRADEHLDGESH